MIICGKDLYILSQCGTNASVSEFANNLETIKNITIVDAVIAYNCADTQKVWLLIVGNILFVASTNNNFVPPFNLREGSMVVNNRAKIHHPIGLPSLKDYLFGDGKILVTFELSGILSISNSRYLMNDDFLKGC